MDAGKYYALLRFEEASVALRAALQLEVVDKIGDRSLDLREFQIEFGFTEQGARTFAALLEVMEVVQRKQGTIEIAPRASAALAQDLPTTRRPYLAMGTDNRVPQLIAMLRGQFDNSSLPLYGGSEDAPSIMDQPDAAREIAFGLASRARNFATPLARAIKPYSNKAKIVADIGAGSPYVAVACAEAMPRLSRVILVDRGNSMPYAREMVTSDLAEAHVLDKLDYQEHDFFHEVPPADIYCVSNTAHDWLKEEYTTIMTNVRDAIAPGGVVCIHEPILPTKWNSAAEWVRALWMASYALTLYKLCKGKGTCYTRQEHDETMRRSGFGAVGEPVETCDGCTALFYKLESDIAKSDQPTRATQSQALPR